MRQRAQRRSPRLPGYDYAQAGVYFVTVCTHERAPLFGQVAAGAIVVNAWGQVAQTCWDAIPQHFPLVTLDAFVVMPNHVHGILVIGDAAPVGATHGSPLQPDGSPAHRPQGAAPGSLGAIVGQYKSSVTRCINRLPDPPSQPVWQRSYHDHIIRSQADLERIRDYVLHNPARWHEDSLFA